MQILIGVFILGLLFLLRAADHRELIRIEGLRSVKQYPGAHAQVVRGTDASCCELS